ncbi:MAG: YihA family ribosome biogenesis GTP-binding protein [Clostridia bacterium]|nr:YihA family ribosome biogenesis GTP-binding protein [Clostridia bacterium]
MNYHKAEFIISAVSKKQFLNDLPEIVFCGKSNVGKSSILNCLLGRKALARTSSKPGKTAQINYFKIDDCCYFVDLPGYGYAKVSDNQLKKWGEYISTYFSANNNKALVVLLMDIRHKPTLLDLQMADMLADREIPYIIVGTKLDKLNKREQAEQIAGYESYCAENDTYFIPFSAKTLQGKDEVLNCIEQAIEDMLEEGL